MTISVAASRNEYTANAAQTIFNYTFKIFADTDLNVYITPSGQIANDSTDLTVAYTVTGLGDEDGGTIILASGTNANDLVTIVSDVPSSRTINYQNNGDFRPVTVNSDFDRVVSIVKKIEDTTNRSVLLQQSQQDPKPLSLPSPVAQALMRWKGDLTGLENVFVSELSPGVFPNDAFTLQSTLAAVRVDTGILAGQVYILSDRDDAIFDVISGTGTDNGANIVEHDTLDISFVLRINGPVTLKSYGAPITGSGDAHDAFQVAIDTAEDIIIDDDYTIDSPLQTRPNRTYSGKGTVRKGFDGPLDNSLSVMFLDSDNGSSNNKFHGLTIIGRHENDIDAAIAALDAGQRDVAIDFRDGTGYDFSRNIFNGFSYNHIRLDGTATTQDPSQIIVNRNLFLYSANNGLWMKHGIIDVVVTSNICMWMGNVGIGIDDSSTADTYGPQPRRLTISANILFKTAQRSIAPAILVQGVVGASITGNQVYSSGNAVGPVVGNGIQVDSGGNGNVGENKGEGINLTGNSIFDCSGGGILSNGMIGGVISGNSITDAAGSGGIVLSNSPVLGNPCERVSVTGNWIGSSDGGPAMTRGIYIFDATQLDNRVQDDNTFHNCITDIDDLGTVSGAEMTSNSNVMRGYKDMRQTSLTLLIQNDGGTIEHRIISGLFTANTEYYDRVNAASSSFSTTPTVDGSTAFVAGLGLDSGGVNRIIFDTGDFAGTIGGEGIASIGRNTTLTAITARPSILTKDVNGVTTDRLAIQIYDAATGGSINISSIPVGTMFEVQIIALIT